VTTPAAEAPKSTLEAVTAALEVPKPAETPPLEEEEREEEEAGGEEGGNLPEEPAEEPAGEPDTKADDKTAAAPPSAGKDGKTAEAKADEKPVTEPAKKPAEPKAVDALNDPIPQGVATRTKERIETLIGFVKERDQQLAQANELFTSIESTGVTPDNFATMLGYLRVVNNETATPQELEQALALIQSEARGLALRLGKPVAGVDFLAEHDDLRTAVENGTMTEQLAHELAIARTKAKNEGETRTATAAHLEQQRQAAAAHKRGTDALIALG
jgi:hypothetical protein